MVILFCAVQKINTFAFLVEYGFAGPEVVSNLHYALGLDFAVSLRHHLLRWV